MARFFVNQLLKYTKSLHLMLLEVTMASFNGQVATPRWNTGISETPLPLPSSEIPILRRRRIARSSAFLRSTI